MMIHGMRLLVLAALLGLVPLVRAAGQTDSVGPNVVFLLADDLGWRDLSCYGSPFCETPHIDRLAERGMRFTNAYTAASICSPTRASLMTGKYPARTGITDYIPGLPSPADKMLAPRTAMRLELSEVTLGEMFQQAGYQTFYTGKWHLGDKGFEPPQQGFEFYVGDEDLGKHSRDWRVASRMTAAFDNFVQHQRDPNKPFLAVLAFHEPHTPILEYPEHIEHFTRKAQRLGATPPARRERDGLTRARQDDAAYGSEVAGLDTCVGQILDMLDAHQLTQETIIIFFSDNGGLSTKAQPGPTNNDPLRAGKGWLYEGGVRVPLIVSVPGKVAPGSVSEQITVSCDLLPTMLELAGLPPQPEQHIDGRSLAPVLVGSQKSLPPRPIFWHYPHYHGSTWAPGAAMRDGDWKLIQFDHYRQVELYNLANDLSESHNLAYEQPRRARAMQAQLADWQASVGAVFATPRNLMTENLVAWCVVPFDAAGRGPQERAAMLKRLGLTKLAYDWREAQVPTWDAEVDALHAADIDLSAFWCPSSLEPAKDARVRRIIDFLERRDVHTQLWVSLPDNELAKIADEGQRVEKAAGALQQLAKMVEPLGCQVGLYNHGGWIGKPETMVRIMQSLPAGKNIGLVYNFHHAHNDLSSFPEALHDMRPYLLCLNLNGTSAKNTETGEGKIKALGSGELDKQLLSWIRQAQYAGPIGILDHRSHLDAEQSLRENLDGLQRLLE